MIHTWKVQLNLTSTSTYFHIKQKKLQFNLRNLHCWIFKQPKKTREIILSTYMAQLELAMAMVLELLGFGRRFVVELVESRVIHILWMEHEECHEMEHEESHQFWQMLGQSSEHCCTERLQRVQQTASILSMQQKHKDQHKLAISIEQITFLTIFPLKI